MFNLGFAELLVIAAVGLIVLGPDKFPKAVRGVARFLNELKKAFSEAKQAFGFKDVQEETDKIIKEAVSGTDVFQEADSAKKRGEGKEGAPKEGRSNDHKG